MGTEKPRFTITMDEDLLSYIDDYKFENRIKNQSKAIVQLVRAGLDEVQREDTEAIEKASDADKTAPEATRDIEAFKAVLERANIMEHGKDISKSDLDFLRAMFLALKAHFQKGDEDGE